MENKDVTRLVLGRKEGESVIVDGPCMVQVIRSKGKGARLLFTAPVTTKIVRKEIANVADNDVGKLWLSQ